jgi:uncharacterized membrane protein (UPF0127 family)
LLTVAFLVVGVAAVLVAVLLVRHASAPIVKGTTVRQRTTQVELNGHNFTTVIADTIATRAHGLSDTTSLAADHGMLFVFNPSEPACFWMKDMHYNLDILWFDDQQKLIYEQQNLSLLTYPNSYCPPASAKYVLEVNAGTAQQLQAKLGDQLHVRNSP